MTAQALGKRAGEERLTGVHCQHTDLSGQSPRRSSARCRTPPSGGRPRLRPHKTDHAERPRLRARPNRCCPEKPGECGVDRGLRRHSAGSPGYAAPAQPGRRRSRRTKPYPVTPPSRHCRTATSNLPDRISFRSRPVRFSHLLTTAVRSHTPRTPQSGASKPIRHKPVEAHMLFGSFADKATVNLCRDTHHEPA